MYQLLKLLPPEAAHKAALWGLKHGLGPTIVPNPNKATSLFGKPVPNLIGLSAGFDKQAEALEGIFKLGFGFIEAGSVSVNPRAGNAFRPRHWRSGGNAAFNAYGLNSNGLLAFAKNLRTFREKHGQAPLIGASLVNPDKDSPHNVFSIMAHAFSPLVNYFTINFSCPNSGEEDRSLGTLKAQIEQTLQGANGKPVLVKLGPFFRQNHEQLRQTVEAALAAGANGFVATNTLTHAQAKQQAIFPPGFLEQWPRNDQNEIVGGYSGPALMNISVSMVRALRQLAPTATIIGVGGVQSNLDAERLFSTGANAVQLLTGLTVKGPRLMRELVQ